MARNKRTGIELTAYDDLFETDESRAEANLRKIREIPISEIDEFPDHPFKVLMNEDMEQLVESVSLILSILVDTFFTRISMLKLQHSEIRNISVA